MPNRSDHLFERARESGGKIAVRFLDEAITFAQLADRVCAVAAGLARCGIRRASRVGVMIPSSPEFIVVQQALFFLGATFSPLNIFYRPGEVAHAIESCDLDHLVVPTDLLDRVPRRQDGSAALVDTVVIDAAADDPDRGLLSLPRAMDGAAPANRAAIGPDDVAMLLNTSATTGKSKGVMLTAANLAANYDRTPAWLGIGRDDVILCALPLYNTFGLNQCINAMLVTGATMVLLPRFDAATCIDAVARFGCTFLPAVPTMLQKIVDEAGAVRSGLSSVRTVMTGGAPVPATLLRRVLAAMGGDTVVLTGYGLTEATALVTLTAVRLDAEGEVEHGRTIGRVLDGMELAIHDENGAVLPAGSVGEIVVRGPNLMHGYHRAEADTSSVIVDGWLHSGDLGYLDEAGYAFIVDRKKDVIIRGGQNIYPADIEEALYGVAGVAEAAVIGIADDLMGEVPLAFVALRPAAEVSASALLQHCKAELAPYKIPVDVVLMPELPKGPTGKILRRALRPVLQPQA